MFLRNFSIHLQGEYGDDIVSPKRLYVPTIPHGPTTLKSTLSAAYKFYCSVHIIGVKNKGQGNVEHRDDDNNNNNNNNLRIVHILISLVHKTGINTESSWSTDLIFLFYTLTAVCNRLYIFLLFFTSPSSNCNDVLFIYSPIPYNFVYMPPVFFIFSAKYNLLFSYTLKGAGLAQAV
jgi:hypothetical protein